MPSAAAVTQPTTIPMTGAQSRTMAEPRSNSTATTTSVTNAVTGAATGSTSAASSKSPKTTEDRVIDSIIITVPPTVGVTTRRRMKSHLEMAIWTAAVTSVSAISVAGPPSVTAVMQNGMANGAVAIGITEPAPTGPTRLTCSRVATPTTSSEAKTIHTRYGSPSPDAVATITGVISNVAEAMKLNCRPRPRVARRGGLSCAS